MLHNNKSLNKRQIIYLNKYNLFVNNRVSRIHACFCTGMWNTSLDTFTQNVLSSTQACTASSSTTVTQPPKPKLNIIDPRFIQNQDVLLQNPGNMSHEQNISESVG
jgi:hypothetical protein